MEHHANPFFFTSQRKNTIYPIIASHLCVGIIVYIIAMSTVNTGARYFAMMLIPSVCSKTNLHLLSPIMTHVHRENTQLTNVTAGPQIMLYKTLNIHMARPYPKRAAGVAMMNSIGGLSNIWASYLYFAPPQYYAAFGTRK